MTEDAEISLEPLERIDYHSAKLSGSAVFGYRRWRIRLSGLAVDFEEASLISRIFTDYANGYDIHQIVKMLNQSGKKTRYEKKWYPKNVQKILENPIYCGYVFSDGKYIRGIYKPIISVKLFNSCQRDENKKIPE